MNSKPISKDFKIMLLQVLQKGSMTGTDRERIETYLRTYFDGWQMPELPQLSNEDFAELIIDHEEKARGATIEGVVAAYEKQTGKRIKPTSQHG